MSARRKFVLSWTWIAVWFGLAGVAAQSPGLSPASLSHCAFHRVDDHFAGTCGPLFDQTPGLTLRSAAAITTGVWRKDLQPTSVWAGEMTEAGSSNESIELEVYSDNSGVLRTEYGWFAVAQFAASSSALSFELDASHEVRANALDEEIVRKAAAILSTSEAWNRADNRKCPGNATTWSIYCAMERATIEVTGGFHHRRPALEAVRQIVEERSVGRNYHHRLMEYNNDPTTRLDDVQSLFDDALDRMKRP